MEIPPMNSSTIHQSRILVLGSSGFLGSNLRLLFSFLPAVYFAHSNAINSRNGRDFLVSEYSLNSITKLVEELGITVILNCVGFTDVDACEHEHSPNSKLNFELPLLLDDLCRSLKVKLVHISTDHFLSQTEIPRSEEALLSAVNEYGRKKLQADEIILRNERTLVVRTNFFGFDPAWRGNLFNWAKTSLENGKLISGFDDVYFTPISVSILGSTLLELIEKDYCGLFNVVSSESISKFHFLRLVAKTLGCDQELVLRDSIRNSNLEVERPNFLSLSNSKLKGRLSGFQDLSISHMISLEIARYGSI